MRPARSSYPAGGDLFVHGKRCLLEMAEELCPENSKQLENVALGANTIALRVAEMDENIVTQIVKTANKTSSCSFSSGFLTRNQRQK